MEIKTIYCDGSVATCDSVPSLSIGTHGQGGISGRYWHLVELFGKPDNGDGYKTQAEWTVLTPDGIATIYDWKQGDCYNGLGNGTPVEDVTEWSVGGLNPKVVEWIEKAMAKTPMKLYAKITSERDSNSRNKGGNEFLQMELSAFGRVIGYVTLDIADDAEGKSMQYLLRFSPLKDADESVILTEGHQKEGVIQTIKA